MHRALIATACDAMIAALLACAVPGAVLGQAPAASTASPAPGPAAKTGGPSWSQLNADQKEALSPLAGDWDSYDTVRKKKWLQIAARYKDLSPEGQQLMHERMPDLARLTPEQRHTARENFKHAYSLPPEQRRELTQKYQDLPPEKRRELAELSKKKASTTPRRANAAHAAPAPHPEKPTAPGQILPASAETGGGASTAGR
jgi:hypothetical protein